MSENKEQKKNKKINHMNLIDVRELMVKMRNENQQWSKKFEQLVDRERELLA